MDEEQLLSEVSYHGYLPREDVVSLLNQHGDFLLRTAECDPKFTKESIDSNVVRKRYLVISVLVDPEGKLQKQNLELETKESLIKSIIVNQAAGNKLCVEGNARFDNVGQMLCHYRDGIRIGNLLVPLRKPVKLAKWEYAHKDVTVGKVIGAGAFGEVFKGKLKKKTGKTVAVAIKTMKVSADATRKEKIDESMREARLMRGLSHPNIVKLYGVAVCEQPIYILIEYVVGGSLDEYLKKNAKTIDREEKLQMTIGAAWGLAYLHGEGLIHRDIAARNCLYDESKNVKISDFGLSRQCTTYNMKTSTKMPLKWMAPESIELYKFSQKTDVYSYGILIYEIFSATPPYEGQNNADAKKNILEGKCNTFPTSTPKGLTNFVTGKLWLKNSEERPSMQKVARWMEKYTGFTLVLDEEDDKSAARKLLAKTRQPQDESKEVVVASKADTPPGSDASLNSNTSSASKKEHEKDKKEWLVR